MIEIEHLTVRFGPSTAVRDVSLSVKNGESFGLVGESGSGKSTLLRTVMGLNWDWDGTITIDGQDVRKVGRKQLARIAQMVFQDPYASLHPRYAVGQQIAEPMRINAIPNAELTVIPDAGHSPQFENPDAWWAALSTFLARVDARV